MKLIKKFWQENRNITLLFLGWRIYLTVLGFLGFRLLTFKASFPQIDEVLHTTGFPQWVWQWGNFDGIHYIDIAWHGYHGSGVQVFFPLYPLMMRLMGRMLAVFTAQGEVITWAYFISGLIISHLSILAGAIFLSKMVRERFGQGVANWSVLFMFFFPMAFFFGTVYSESLFLLLVILSFYAQGRFAGIAAGLASATRLIGIFITPAIFFFQKRNRYILIGLSGLGAYVVYLFLQFSNPFYFLSAQAAFRNQRANSLTSLVTPPQVVIRYLKIFVTANHSHPDFWVALLEFSAFLFGVFLLAWLTVKRKVPDSWLVFSWLALLLPSFSGSFSSMPRYLLTIFPIYVGLAQIKSGLAKLAILAIFIILLTGFTILFTRGYWIS